MATTSDIVSQLVNSDLIDRLNNNQEPTPDQLTMLSVPGVTKSLEKLWYMPITDDPKYLVMNYPTHHYTTEWNKYHTLDEAFELSVNDGNLEFVKTITGKRPDYVMRYIRSLYNSNWYRQPMTTRGRTSVISFFIKFYSSRVSSMTGEKEILTFLAKAYYYAICFNGDVTSVQTNSMKIKTSRYMDPYDEQYPRTAAIAGKQMAVLGILDTLDKDEERDPSGDLMTAIRYANVEVIHHVLEHHPHLLSGRAGDYVAAYKLDATGYSKLKLLPEALASGDLATTNIFIHDLDLKPDAKMAKYAIEGQNLEIISMFEQEINRNFSYYESAIIDTGNLELLKYFGARHDIRNWGRVLETAYRRYNFGLLDYVIQNHTYADVREINTGYGFSKSPRIAIFGHYILDHYVNLATIRRLAKPQILTQPAQKLTIEVVDALVRKLDASDLSTYLFENRKLNLNHMAGLSIPAVVRGLEKLWYMPITGSAKFLILNYPAHNYTPHWKLYHSTGVWLAINSGYIDVVKTFMEQDQNASGQIIRDLTFKPPNYIIQAGRRGRVTVLAYLLEYFKAHPEGYRITSIIQTSYYYAICLAGDFELFETLKYDIYRFDKNAQFFRLARDAAIEGGHIDILNSLNELKRRKNPSAPLSFKIVYDDLMKAARYGRANVVDYILAYQPVPKYNSQQNRDLLSSALTGGNPKVINTILILTKLKFSIGYLPAVIVGNNMSTMYRFQKQFPDAFPKAVFEHASVFIYGTSFDMIAFGIDYGVDDWKEIAFVALETFNFALVDLMVQSIEKTEALHYLGEAYDYHRHVLQHTRAISQFRDYIETNYS